MCVCRQENQLREFFKTAESVVYRQPVEEKEGEEGQQQKEPTQEEEEKNLERVRRILR